ncbi:MAG: pilin [bacterium]
MKKQIRKILSLLLVASAVLGTTGVLFAPNALAAAVPGVTLIEVQFTDPLPLINPQAEPNAGASLLKVIIGGNGGDVGYTNGRLEYILQRTGWQEDVDVIIFKANGDEFRNDTFESFNFPAGDNKSAEINLGIKIVKKSSLGDTGFPTFPNGSTIIPGKITFKTTVPQPEKLSIEKEIKVKIPPYKPAGGSDECVPACNPETQKCVNKVCVQKDTVEPTSIDKCNAGCAEQFSGFDSKIYTCQEDCCSMGTVESCQTGCDNSFTEPDKTTCRDICAEFLTGDCLTTADCKKSGEICDFETSTCILVGASSPIESVSGIDSLIRSVARWIAILISIIAVIFIILGGVSYLTAGGDETKTTSAKNKIIYGLIGLGVAALAWGAEALVRSILGMGK